MKRYYNLLSQNGIDLLKKQIIFTKRFWEFQTSGTDENHNLFLLSELDSKEISFFMDHFKTLLRTYDPKSHYYLKRAYINCNPIGHPGNYHRDDGDLTLLYYPDLDFFYENSGGTEFENIGIEPYINNSAIIFPAHLIHKSQDHNNPKMRFTIAFKFELDT